MLDYCLFVFFVVITALVFAFVEIQIEGKHGWANKLPTWKVENRWTRIFFSGRPLTGYHFYVVLFILLLAHIPYAVGVIHVSLGMEMRILSFILLFWVVEDFLWFVINPEYGLRKFKAEHIWWHAPNWWWIMPREYWIFTPIGIALYVGSWMF